MLANNGINPSSGEKIVPAKTVIATVTLMQSCGMYDFSGKFTKDYGVPTKCGRAGGLLSIIPGIGALGTWSPPLNEDGNSVRGIAMVERLEKSYNNVNLFHKDPLIFDMTKQHYSTLIEIVIALCAAAATGDFLTVERLYIKSPHTINEVDYDRRTPLHLASANGHFSIVMFLVERGATINPKDRWGYTPLDDAQDLEI